MAVGYSHHKVIYGLGNQTIKTVPLNDYGRPTAISSCTYSFLMRVSEKITPHL